MRNASPGRAYRKSARRARSGSLLLRHQLRRIRFALYGAPLRVKVRCELNLQRKRPGENEAHYPFRFPCAIAEKWRAARSTAGSAESYFLRSGVEYSGNNSRHAIPFLSFGLEPAFSGAGQAIEFGFAFVFRFAPLTGNPATMFQAIKCGIE